MEITLGQFILIAVLAFVCEYLDSSLGMGYGTILVPTLIIMGFNPLVVIPAILLSQAVGGFTASIFHHQFQNANFHPGSRDSKIVFVISSFGLIATVFAAIIAVNIPKIVLKTYIGILVIVMGIVLLSRFKFRFSWKKIIGLGILSAFNKGITGGGFGPVITSGQIISGQDSKGAVGCTTFAEAPICTTAFFTYLIARVARELPRPLMNMPAKDFLKTILAQSTFQWEILVALLIGAVSVAPFGALTTKIVHTDKLRHILGMLIIVLGIWTLAKSYLF
jgi:uncharacterized membrane protein YfcA